MDSYKEHSEDKLEMKRNSEDKPYSYEKKKNQIRSFKYQAEQDYPTLLARLNIKKGEIPEILKTVFVEVIYNCLYYEYRIKKEKRERSVYMIFTFLLAIGAPILFVFLSEIEVIKFNISMDGITLLLSVLLGLHTMISKIFEKRVFLGQFKKASYDLQELLRNFEQKWKNIDISNKNSSFKLAILELENDSRKIVQDETISYYEKYINPSFDVGHIIKTSKKTADEIANSFRSQINKDQIERTTTKTILLKEKEMCELSIAQFDKLIKVETDRLKGMNLNNKLRTSIEKYIQTLEDKRREYQIKLIQNNVKLNINN